MSATTITATKRDWSKLKSQLKRRNNMKTEYLQRALQMFLLSCLAPIATGLFMSECEGEVKHGAFVSGAMVTIISLCLALRFLYCSDFSEDE